MPKKIKKKKVNYSLLLVGAVVLGLVIRLAFVPQVGYEFDVSVNKGWARSAVELGFARSYKEQVNGNMLPNYPPASILIFGGVGYVERFLEGGFDMEGNLFHLLIKLPSIIADLMTCVLVYFVLRRIRNRQAGIFGAFAYAVHPAVIYDTAVWGQTDSLFTCFAVAALAAFTFRKPFLVGLFVALSVLTKVQGIIFVPLVFALLFLHVPFRHFLRGIAGAALAMGLVLFPFALGGSMPDVINVYRGSVGYYPTVVVGAYNLWWSLFADAAWSMDANAHIVPGISYRVMGLLLFSATYLVALIGAGAAILRATKDGKRAAFGAWFAVSLVAYGFFVLNTEMHERYLFPFMALGLPVAFSFRKVLWPYIAGSVLFFFNLLGILPYGSFDRALYERFPLLDAVVATIQVVAFFTWLGAFTYWAWPDVIHVLRRLRMRLSLVSMGSGRRVRA